MVRLLRTGGDPEVLRPEHGEALIPHLRETGSSAAVVILCTHLDQEIDRTVIHGALNEGPAHLEQFAVELGRLRDRLLPP